MAVVFLSETLETVPYSTQLIPRSRSYTLKLNDYITDESSKSYIKNYFNS